MGTVYTVDSWTMNDKTGRPLDDPQPSPDVVAMPQASVLGTPQQEFKRTRLTPRIESMEVRYLRLFPATTFTHDMRFASTGKTIRPRHSSSIPALAQGWFGVPANFRQNPVFNISNRDTLEAEAANPAPSQQSVDMLGILIDNLTPEASTQSEKTDISPAKPRDLTAVFADKLSLDQQCSYTHTFTKTIPEPRKHRYVDYPCQV